MSEVQRLKDFYQSLVEFQGESGSHPLNPMNLQALRNAAKSLPPGYSFAVNGALEVTTPFAQVGLEGASGIIFSHTGEIFAVNSLSLVVGASALPTPVTGGFEYGLIKGHPTDFAGVSYDAEIAAVLGVGITVPGSAWWKFDMPDFGDSSITHLDTLISVFMNSPPGTRVFFVTGSEVGGGLEAGYTIVRSFEDRVEYGRVFDGTVIFDDPDSREVIEILRTGDDLSFVEYLQRVLRCFSAGTPVSMWPVDAGLVPGSDGIYNQKEVLRHIWHKPIEQVSKTDLVVAHDAAGNLVPGTVTQTFVNEVDHVLDVFGLKVTPGHVTLCGGGPLKGRYVPMLDIIRSDGAFVREDGTLVRAATNCPVGSPGDRKVQMIGGVRAPNGDVTVHETGWVRLGMRGVLADGRDVSMLDLLEQNGSIVTDDGLVATAPGEKGAKLLWPFAPHLPKPEDYILARSGVTLEEIEAAEAEENALWQARASGQIPASLAAAPAGNDAPTHGFVMALVGASSGHEPAVATSPSPVPQTEPASPDLSHWGELSTPDYSALNERQAEQTPLNRQQRRNQAKMVAKQATPAQQHSSTIH